MGLIRAAIGALGSSLGDQYLEAFEPADMGEGVVFAAGTRLRPGERRDSNRKGTEDAISNGSVIHVYDAQCALIVDNGKIVDMVAEPGLYTFDKSSLPSIFVGQLGDSVKESFNRFRFGGANPTRQMVCYINLQEIKGIKFGTKNAIQYFDNFYNAELFLRCFGTYSIRITDPVLFYQQAIPRNARLVHIDDINEQYLNEFLEALQASINAMSGQGVRISSLPSKSPEVSNYMQDALDQNWKATRGFEVQAVGIASISYDDDSRELINMRNKGAMLGDPAVREGYVQGSIARGMEAAGANTAGAGTAFMGMGIGMSGAGNFMGAASATNLSQMQSQQARQAQTPAQVGGAGVPAAAGDWTCPKCGTVNQGKFCSNCGSKRPEGSAFCSNCGYAFQGPRPKFCPNCGAAQE